MRSFSFPPQASPWALRLRLLGLGLACMLLLPALPGCAEGIVLDAPERFPQQELVLPTPEPTPMPSPSTPLEKIQVKVVAITREANKYNQYTLPLSLALGVLFGLFRLLRWIYDLTTTSPPLA